jgi:molybdopterin molybdotransferase
MITVTEARERLSANLERSDKRRIPLVESLGLILAEDVHSPIDVPSFDNSSKDGYAFKFDAQRHSYELGETIQAGDTASYQIPEGKAARIFTGAKMPEATDTVVPQELIKSDEKDQRISFKNGNIRAGSNVRYKGSQCKKGDMIAEKETKITPGTIGLLASVGLAEVEVFSPPKVDFIITGNELKEIGSSLKPGEIYDCNGPMLEALLKESRICDISASMASDDKEALQKAINYALEQTDVLILSGGISVGDYDFVEECLKKAGVEEVFYKVRQRPGKPFFAGKKDRQWVFALPGNPGSVFNCFNQYVKPCLKYLMGHNDIWQPDAVLPLQEDQKKKSGFTFFLKAKREGDKVKILGSQQSFNMRAFSRANCIVELDEESEMVKAGTPVKIFDL